MGEPTMEEYMTKTREDYRSGIARPKINEKARFELKGQFLKELSYNTFNGSDNEDANEHIKKKGLDVPTRQILNSKGAIPFMKPTDAKKAIPDMADHSQKWHNGTSTRTRSTDTSDGLTTIQAQLNNLEREIKKLQAMGFGSLPGSTETNQRDYVKSIKVLQEKVIWKSTCQLIDDSYKEKDVLGELIDRRESATNLKRLLREKPRMGYQIEVSINVHDSAILEDSLPPKEKDQESFTIPCHINNICFEKALADLGASISVMPYSTFTNLGLGELAPTKLIIELADRTIKRPKGLRERMELDLEARLMGEDLILKRSLDLTYEDYIELNDLNKPLKIRRNQVEDLGPTIEDGEVIDKPMVDIVKTRNDDEIVGFNRNDDEIEGIDEYLSFCDFDKKIHIDCAYNLQLSCMIGFEHLNANFFPILSINVMSKGFYNSIMKDKIKYRGKNVVGAFMNVPIFVGNFFVVIDFVVLENMDAYRDQDMGEIIVGEPFCRKIRDKK
ncbi:homeodomain-like protein [Tanacetum coccineum]